jgi:hypothetical protein
LWTFNGRNIQKADKPFNPSGMAESEDGNVILTITRSFDNSEFVLFVFSLFTAIEPPIHNIPVLSNVTESG